MKRFPDVVSVSMSGFKRWWLPGLLCMAGTGGCAGIGDDQFGCAGMPVGVQCLSARQVYEATEHTDTVTAPPSAEAPPASPVPTDGWQNRTGDGPAPAVPPPAPTVPPAVRVTQKPVLPRLDGPMPIRTPAQVLRIWFGPWEDPAGNLHLTGYVYTEIEPRRWALGTPAPVEAPTLRPLQLAHRETGRSPPGPPAGVPPAAGGATPPPLFKSKP